jgi:DNA polymerase III sliding clamp (beta) subunit (PCNA family)
MSEIMIFTKNELASVLCAASSDVTRYSINGVRFEADKLIATDGHRLHMVTGSKVSEAEAPNESVTIESEACKRIISAMGTKDTALIVDTSDIDGSAKVRVSSGVELTCEVIQGEYPNYSQVIPERSDTKKRLIVNARYLKSLCEAAIKAEGMSKSKAPILIELPDDELSPIRVDGQALHSFTAVLMPQRA